MSVVTTPAGYQFIELSAHMKCIDKIIGFASPPFLIPFFTFWSILHRQHSELNICLVGRRGKAGDKEMNHGYLGYSGGTILSDFITTWNSNLVFAHILKKKKKKQQPWFV